MTSILRPNGAGGPSREAGGAPRESAPQPPASSESGRIYREGMSRVVSAVNVISTDGPAGLAGFTATAVTSVSDEPPLLLVCMHRTAQSCARVLANGVFCVNTLAAGSEHLAQVFAGRTGLHLDARFQEGRWETHPSGAPLLAGSAVSFVCRLVEVKDVATHHVLFGEVIDVRLGAAGRSLAWLDRGFHTV